MMLFHFLNEGAILPWDHRLAQGNLAKSAFPEHDLTRCELPLVGLKSSVKRNMPRVCKA